MMFDNNRIAKIVAVLGFVAIGGLAGAYTLAQPRALAQGAAGTPPRTITVNGTGSATGVPDLANIQLGVDARDTNPAVAYEAADDQIETIAEALISLGIAAGDMQTSGFNLYWTDRYNPETGQPSDIREYHAQHTLNVTVREIDQTGEVINGAVSAGANVIHGLNFGIADETTMTNEARLAALADARDRAEQIAGAIGGELGEVVSISEGVTFVPVMMNSFGGMGGGGDAASISEGTLSVEVQVTVTYLIAE